MSASTLLSMRVAATFASDREIDAAESKTYLHRMQIMKIQNSTALVTGANRGIGRELVLALKFGAKMSAGARDAKTLNSIRRCTSFV